MQKTEFLSQVQENLTASGFDDAKMQTVLTRLSEYFDSLSPEALETELSECSDPRKTAQVLLSGDQDLKPRRRIHKPAPDLDTDSTSTDETVVIDLPGASKDGTTVIEATVVSEEPDPDLSGETVKIDVVSDSVKPRSERSEADPPVRRSSQTKPAQSSLRTTRAIKYADLDRVVAVDPKNRIIFWCVFALLSPAILFLILLVLAVFASVFLAMAVAIAGCLAALVGIVGVGTGVSLFGLIYGTTQLFSALSAGLYEIGIAIIVAGASLFTGILLYNTAIRLMPFLMKYLYVFFCFVMKKGFQLFQFIRRECTGR